VEHLRWKLSQDIRVREDDYASLKTGGAKGRILQLTGDTSADVWIGPREVWFRVEGLALTPKNELERYKREFALIDNYAVLQQYDCGSSSTEKALSVCSIRVIPTFGPSREWDVNELQYPTDNSWVRMLMMGRIPDHWDGLPMRKDGSDILFKTYGNNRDRVLTPSTDLALYYRAYYTANRISGIDEYNAWDNSVIRAFRDIRWDGNRITRFRVFEESPQAKKVSRPVTTLTAVLETVGEEPCPVKLKKGATLFDYRLCKPVAFGKFPDRSCPPKFYKYIDGLKSIEELEALDEALFPPRPENLSNAIPAWLVFAIGCTLLGAAGCMFWFVRLRKRL
jgi:hypothetical protein